MTCFRLALLPRLTPLFRPTSTTQAKVNFGLDYGLQEQNSIKLWPQTTLNSHRQSRVRVRREPYVRLSVVSFASASHLGADNRWRVCTVFAVQQRIEATASMSRPGRASHASRPHWPGLAVQPLRVAMAVLALQPMLSLASCNPHLVSGLVGHLAWQCVRCVIVDSLSVVPCVVA